MKSIGKTIQYNRRKKKWTQQQLATGLISISYLSKIENEQIIPTREITALLCERLGIEHNEDQNQQFVNEIQSWYEMLVARNIQQATQHFQHLQQKMKQCTSFYANTYYQLVSIRYFMMMNERQTAKKMLQPLIQIENKLPNNLRYFYFKFRGNVAYSDRHYDEAYELFMAAKDNMTSALSTYEKGDVYYALGLTTCELYRYHTAIMNTLQALNYFQRTYTLKRCCECHLLLSILYQKVHEFDEAKIHYEKVSALSEQLESTALSPLIYHNLGTFCYVQNDLEGAMLHFEKALACEQHPVTKLSTLMTIVKMQYSVDNRHLWTASLERGITLIGQSKIDERLSIEYTIFSLLKENNEEAFVNYVMKIALPYFEKHEDLEHRYYYGHMLATYFKQKRQYKKAASYFEYCTKLFINRGGFI